VAPKDITSPPKSIAAGLVIEAKLRKTAVFNIFFPAVQSTLLQSSCCHSDLGITDLSTVSEMRH
jgi:hypothetical protein